MTEEALNDLLVRDPFIPLRLRLDDGRMIEIDDPQCTVIDRGSVFVYKLRRAGGRIADDNMLISLNHVVSVETSTSKKPV